MGSACAFKRAPSRIDRAERRRQDTCFNLLSSSCSRRAAAISYKGKDITTMAAADVANLGMVRSFKSRPCSRT